MQLAGVGVDLNVGLLLPLAHLRCSLPLSKGFAVLMPLLTVGIPRLFGGGSGGLEVLLVLLVAVF